jgi:uncharacterized membrane protein required for colicin V production
MLGRAFEKIGLGCLDRLAGGLFGLVQGVLLVSIIILVAVAFVPNAQWLTESRLPREFFGALHWSTRISPAGLSDRIHEGLRLLEKDTPDWVHPNWVHPDGAR